MTEGAPQYWDNRAPSQGAYPQQSAAPTGPPPNNVGWAVASVIFFWPLAFSAFTHSMNVFPMWMSGNHQGAMAASERAKTLGKISLGIFIGLWVLLIVFYVILFAVIINSASNIHTTV